RLGHDSAATGAAILVDRVLARVHIAEGGLQTYRVSYLLTCLSEQSLKFELPAPSPSLNLRVALDGKQLPLKTFDDSEKPSVGGRIAQFNVPLQAMRKPVVIDVSYQLQALRTGSGVLQATVQP